MPSNTGSAIIDFGAGATQVSTVVATEASISSTSFVDAFIMYGDTTGSHTVADHLALQVRLLCGSAIAGTGFTIWAQANATQTGQYMVRWVWADVAPAVPASVPFWQKITIGRASLTAAATTQTVTILAIGPRQIITGLVVKHTTSFIGGALIAMTITVGDSAQTVDYYMATPLDVFQAASNTAFEAANVIALGSFAGSNVQVTFTSVGANVSAATLGSVDFDICTVTIP